MSLLGVVWGVVASWVTVGSGGVFGVSGVGEGGVGFVRALWSAGGCGASAGCVGVVG